MFIFFAAMKKYCFWVSILFGLSLNAQIPDYVSKDGNIGWWPLNGNANDSSEYGNNGVVYGATLTTDRFGSTNKAYSFNGINNYVEIPEDSLLRPKHISISAWFLTSNNQRQSIVSKTNFSNAYNEMYNLAVGGQSGLSVKVSNSCTNVGKDWARYFFTVDSFQVWNHIVSQWDGTSFEVFINGKKVDGKLSGDTTGNITEITNCKGGMLQFGRWWKNDPIYFNGKLDDIGMWNRPLTPCEISQLYKSKKLIPYSGNHYTLNSCEKDSLNLVGKSGFETYSWNDGKKGIENTVKLSGQYILTMTDSNGCIAKDTFQISLLTDVKLPSDELICRNETVALNSVYTNQHSTCSVPHGSLSNGLVGWWPFCGGAEDYSGNNNDGRVFGAILSEDRYSNSNSALSFNGNNSVRINANSNLDLGIKDSYSISCWMTFDSLNRDQALIEKWNDRSDTPYPFRLRISNGLLTIGRYISRTKPTEDSTTTQACGFELSSIGTKTYFHVVSVYTPDTIFLYINDTLRSFRKNYLDTTKDVKNNLPLYFGQRGNNMKFFYGYLDDIGVWNRALTKEEISYLYTIGDKKTLPITWSTGDTSSQITVSPVVDTQYWVSVSDGSTTCYDTCMVRVSNPKSTVLADSISCFGLQDGSANLSTSGGIAPYAIQWSTGDTTSLLSNLIAGTYAAVVTDSIGCTDSVSIELTEPPLLKLSVVTIDSVNCFNGFDGSASVRAEGGNTGGYTFLWNDPDLQTDSLAIGLAFGQYKVRVLDTKGCSDSLTIDVGQPPLLQLSLLNSQDPSCYNDADGFISTSATGGTPGYTFIWNLSPDPGTDSVASLPSGDYWVYIQDKNGCLDSLNKELINPDQIVVKIQDPIRSIKGLPITLNADVSPSNNYQYTWSPSATFQDQASEQNPTITLDADQGVRLVVVDSNGCIGQDSTTARVLQGSGIIFPNSFSPNDDGRNDFFKPHPYFDLLDLKIYNAWGQCIYQSNGAKDGWDGTFAGEKVPAGAYVYQMQVQLTGTNQIINQSGSVTLVR